MNVNKDDMFRVGVITGPHGVRGEVKVFPTTDDPGRLGKIKCIYLDDGKELKELHPSSGRMQNNLVIMSFKEFQNRDDVERLRQKELFVTRDNAVKLEKDEYYISDLIGLTAIDEEGNILGKLTEVYQTGANDVYEFEKEDGSTILLPAIAQCILDVNISEGTIKVHVLEGL